MVIVATPGVPLFELSAAGEIFGIDRTDITSDWYDFEIAATEPDTRVGFGLGIPQGRGLAALDHAHTVIVPACADIHGSAPAQLLDALRTAHRRGARIAALCSGAFVLAEAGLLDGRRATTHWMHAAELARRYPGITVDPDVLYVHDDVWTSAGSAAAIDLCLELVRQDFGASVANEVARRVVTPPHRDGGQAQYVRHRPRTRTTGDGDVQDWSRRNLADVTVAGMADHANVSQRTLNRQFRARTRLSPQDWIRRERLQATQELLENTTLTLDVIAQKVGFGTPTNLRSHFSSAFGVSPGAYRGTFNAGPGSTTVGQDTAASY